MTWSIWHFDMSELMDKSVLYIDCLIEFHSFDYFAIRTCTISLCSSSFSFINFWYRSSSSFEIPASGLYFDSALSCGCRTTSITYLMKTTTIITCTNKASVQKSQHQHIYKKISNLISNWPWINFNRKQRQR